MQLKDVEATLKARGLNMPYEIVVRSDGYVVADYEIPVDSLQALRARAFGEDRLLAIREALLVDGYKNFRVNVNGPRPGAGLIRRYGSARFTAARGRVEWLRPDD